MRRAIPKDKAELLLKDKNRIAAYLFDESENFFEATFKRREVELEAIYRVDQGELAKIFKDIEPEVTLLRQKLGYEVSKDIGEVMKRGVDAEMTPDTTPLENVNFEAEVKKVVEGMPWRTSKNSHQYLQPLNTLFTKHMLDIMEICNKILADPDNTIKSLSSVPLVSGQKQSVLLAMSI